MILRTIGRRRRDRGHNARPTPWKGSVPTSTCGSHRRARTGRPIWFPSPTTGTVRRWWSRPRASRTAENLIRTGWARVALGPTRDVVIVEGPVEAITIGADPELEDAHALAAGFDPRTLAEEYVYLRITPHEIQAWREANELEGHYVMRGGAWLE